MSAMHPEDKAPPPLRVIEGRGYLSRQRIHEVMALYLVTDDPRYKAELDRIAGRRRACRPRIRLV